MRSPDADAGDHGDASGTVVGTVGYMSPEQASGEALDFRSDQFSLGSIIYEMATGRKAFQKKTAAETLSAIMSEEPEPIAQLPIHSLQLPLRWIVDRCLAKEPEARFASTEDLARDLGRACVTTSRGGLQRLRGNAHGRPGNRGRHAVPIAVAAGLVAAAFVAGVAPGRAQASDRPPEAPSFKRLTFRECQHSPMRALLPMARRSCMA